MAEFDQVGKDTGPGDGGFQTVTKDSSSKVVFEYILSNFNIDGNVLKKEHKDLLDRDIIPFVKENRVHVELLGTASKSGDRAYDQQLSVARVLRVKKYLLSKGLSEAQVPGPDVHAVGKDLSTSKSNEDPIDRAVRIRIAVGIKPRPLFQTIVIPIIIRPDGPEPYPLQEYPLTIINLKEKWTILQTFGQNMNGGVGLGIPGVGVGAGLGPVTYSFLLVNRETSKMAQCTFDGMGVTAGVGPNNKSWGLGPSVGLSITGRSREWNNFETRPGVDFSDFNGTAAWNEPPGVGLGTAISTKGTLAIPSVGARFGVTTGKTVGFPGSSVSTGRFYCGSPVQLHL